MNKLLCDTSQHHLQYVGKVNQKDKHAAKKYKSKCERCEHTFINSVPIGYGAPKGEI